MSIKRNAIAASISATAILAVISAPAQAQFSGDAIKIGYITDMSGVYSVIDGAGAVEEI
jgi:branched-chain amino acid transport system substrate-binding protein